MLVLPAKHKDGSEFSAELSISAARYNGQWQAIGVVRDVTERTQIQAQIQLFRDLLDHSRDVIEVLDPETYRFLDVNLTACRELGLSSRGTARDENW